MGYVTDVPILGRGRGGAHGSTSRHVQIVGGGAPLNAHICRRWNQDLAADIDLDSEGFWPKLPAHMFG